MTLIYKGLAVAALIAAVIFGYKAWEHHVDQRGYKRANGEWELKETQIKADAAERLAKATATARAREQALNRSLFTETEKRLMGNAAYENDLAALRTAVRTRDLRLSVAIDPRSLPGCATPADPAAAGGLGAEARADVVPEVAESILSIGADLAKGVRDFNAINDAYNRARDVCNAGVGGS